MSSPGFVAESKNCSPSPGDSRCGAGGERLRVLRRNRYDVIDGDLGRECIGRPRRPDVLRATMAILPILPAVLPSALAPDTRSPLPLNMIDGPTAVGHSRAQG